jgi:hypothetical protein
VTTEGYAERLARIERGLATNWGDDWDSTSVEWLLAQLRERDRQLWWQREIEQTEIGELMARVDAHLKQGEAPSLDDAKSINGWLVWHVENFVNPQDYEGAVWGRCKAESRVAELEKQLAEARGILTPLLDQPWKHSRGSRFDFECVFCGADYYGTDTPGAEPRWHTIECPVLRRDAILGRQARA